MKRRQLADDILQELCSIPTVDAHEHLPTEKAYLAQPRDVFSLFSHYCQGDLVAAGATEADFEAFRSRDLPLADRWARFKPFFSAIRTGSYAQAVLLVVRDILEIPDLDDTTVEEVSVRFRALGEPGLYDRILRDRCNLAACIQCWHLGEGPFPDYFVHLAPGPEVVDLLTKDALEAIGARHDRAIHGIDDVLACMDGTVARWQADPTVVGVKSAHAYGRSIGFQPRSRDLADGLVQRLLKAEAPLSREDLVPLQDFLMFELVSRLAAIDLPMVFHTGLQAGNRNRIRNADPLLLQPILEAFPNARFDLFHGGMPWVREIAVLAKYFPGVHLNMAWMHIISPAQAQSALSEWLDLVPNTKIFGFGGDYAIVEKVYGHVTLARRTIAAVLADKVASGTYSRADASMLARRLMLENPNRFYGLGLDD